MAEDNRVGLTTTVPVEPIFAAGLRPVDLNNIFVSSSRAGEMVRMAEVHGYPRNICNWIKGIYSAALAEGIPRVVGVVRGDCSNTEGLLDTFTVKGLEVFPFSYPYTPQADQLREEIDRFSRWLGADEESIREVQPTVEKARELAWEIDRRTWVEGTITGGENHLFLVSSSDFMSDLNIYISKARALLEESETRDEIDGVRIGYMGVPPIITDLYDVLDDIGFHVVYNEVQHQFSMPYPHLEWWERYLEYTYPYSIFRRLEFVKEEIKRRKIEGIVHYVQSFCHRQIDDILAREMLDVPILTLEYDTPGPVDERARIRLESFMDILRG